MDVATIWEESKEYFRAESYGEIRMSYLNSLEVAALFDVFLTGGPGH